MTAVITIICVLSTTIFSLLFIAINVKSKRAHRLYLILLCLGLAIVSYSLGNVIQSYITHLQNIGFVLEFKFQRCDIGHSTPICIQIMEIWFIFQYLLRPPNEAEVKVSLAFGGAKRRLSCVDSSKHRKSTEYDVLRCFDDSMQLKRRFAPPNANETLILASFGGRSRYKPMTYIFGISNKNGRKNVIYTFLEFKLEHKPSILEVW